MFHSSFVLWAGERQIDGLHGQPLVLVIVVQHVFHGGREGETDGLAAEADGGDGECHRGRPPVAGGLRVALCVAIVGNGVFVVPYIGRLDLECAVAEGGVAFVGMPPSKEDVSSIAMNNMRTSFGPIMTTAIRRSD